MKYECEFATATWFGLEELYTCRFSDQEIYENEEVFYAGRHVKGFNRMDVTAVWFNGCNMTKVPRNLTERFPNLRLLSVGNSNLRILNKDDLAEYKNLEYLDFDDNQIEFLPHDLFEEFENLRGISFANNNLTFIEPNILNGMYFLESVDFRNNPNYDIYYSLNSDDSIASFEEIGSELYEKFYERFRFVQVLKDSRDNLLFENLVLNIDLEKEKAKNLKPTLAPQDHLTVDLKNLTKDETFKDFKIIIEDREFPVHKFLLAARSPILAEMLRNNPEAENLKLVDISVEIFELILKFLYTDELPNEEGTNFLHLFAAAGRLKIKELKNFAAGKLIGLTNEENALEILNLSNKYGHDELRQKAFGEIKKKFPKIEFKDEWIEDGEKLSKLIESLKKTDEELKRLVETMSK